MKGYFCLHWRRKLIVEFSIIDEINQGSLVISMSMLGLMVTLSVELKRIKNDFYAFRL